MRLLRISMQLAWRNLWRNPRRTLIMISAVTVGVWAMIFMTALMRGMVNDMIRDGIEALPGHVQVHDPAFRDDPSIANLIPVADTELAKRLKTAGIERFSNRINVPAVISSERETRGVTLFGIDPDQERRVTGFADNIVAGRALADADDQGLIIGQKLLGTLETDLGKRVVIMSQDRDNDIADRGFRIVGVFEADLEAYESGMVFAAKNTVRQLLRVGDQVTEIAVAGDDYRHTGPLLADVRRVADSELEVLPWQQLNSYLGSMLQVMDGFVLVWMVVIFLALSFGLVNTLVMAVFERVREIGLMMALGLQPAGILLQVLAESVLLLAIGLSAGTLLAWLTVLPLQDGIDISMVAEGMEMFGAGSRLYPELLPADVALANIVVLVLGFVASLSPAWRASRYDPVAAITKV